MVERVVQLGGVALLLHIPEPEFRLAALASSVHPSLRREAAVGAGTDPDIVAVGPVGYIVTAFLTRGGIIGHFIGRKPGGGANFTGQLIHLG